MSERKIQELLEKYLEGKATNHDKRLIEEWYDSLSGPGGPSIKPEDERGRLRNLYWNSLQSKIGNSGDKRTRSLLPVFLSVAAVITAIVVVSALYFQIGDVQPIPGPKDLVMREIHNESQTIRYVALMDGSKVRLFPGSKLKYDKDFNDKDRQIQLSGEAFFDIARDEQKPFYVYTREVTTKVLGTSFSVRAYPDDHRITVSVSSGKVSVYTQGDDKGTSEDIILTPNQEAVYTRFDQRVARKIVEEPKIIIPEEEVKRIRFDGVAPADIFHALEKMYGVDIMFDEEKFSDCSITTSVNGKDLYERIDVICEITGSRYNVLGTQIVIEGTGCN